MMVGTRGGSEAPLHDEATRLANITETIAQVLYRMMTMRKRNMRVIMMQLGKMKTCSSRSVYHLTIILHPDIYHLDAMQPLQASVKTLKIKKKALLVGMLYYISLGAI